ncbi:MAG: tetratricopeptide repeat protein [Bacteroidetes bacterium]|nr:tetratricopeptide repeat protein [Bacteroidota bacterium]
MAFIATQVSQSKQSSGFGGVIYGQNLLTNSLQSDDLISEFLKLSVKQLVDTGNYYFKKNSHDTALICYSLLINTPFKNSDFEQQKIVIEAYNKSAVIYYYVCDYRSSYDFLIKALLLCEKFNHDSCLARIYTNIGNIYYRFYKHDLAKSYYSKALNFPQDSASIVVLLNNIGAVELENDNTDSAAYYLSKALQASKLHNNFLLYSIWNNIASLYQKMQLYDSAFYYYRLLLNNNQLEKEEEAENLSCLGKLFFEINKTDSALFYIDLSNTIAKENNFLRILAENYLVLSKIEEARGRTTKAFEHFKKYSGLKDSILNVANFGDINQLQRLYEVSKTNQQIEQLVFEQQVKERTIRYQKIIWLITSCVLILVTIGLLFIYLQKRSLSRAYKVLFEKNLKIIELQGNSSERHLEKYKDSTLKDEMHDKLLDRILTLMEDTTIVCDTEFSLDRLAELVESNQTYVSQVINAALKKNFRSFLNDYRIREAQRLFSELDLTKYTIASIAQRVGYKSPTTFRTTFKEITGVTPNFYFKSIQEQTERI